jgi:Ca2+-transporting ATPase
MFNRRDVLRIGVESAVLTTVALGAYGWGLARYGMGPRTSTLTFTTLTTSQLLYAISCRSEKRWLFDRKPSAANPYMTFAVGAGLGLQGITTFLPGLRQVLGTTPLGPSDWLLVLALATAPYLASELTKAIERPCSVDRKNADSYGQ